MAPDAEAAPPADIPIPRKPAARPRENVWRFLRDNGLSNRVFASCDEIVDHCRATWNTLVEQRWRIMSLGLREWAQGSIREAW